MKEMLHKAQRLEKIASVWSVRVQQKEAKFLAIQKVAFMQHEQLLRLEKYHTEYQSQVKVSDQQGIDARHYQ